LAKGDAIADIEAILYFVSFGMLVWVGLAWRCVGGVVKRNGCFNLFVHVRKKVEVLGFVTALIALVVVLVPVVRDIVVWMIRRRRGRV
jgi:hypothetical protein